MGEAKKLQVVDMNQFTKLISLLQKKESDDKVVRDVEMSADKMELLDSHEQMKKSVKNKSPLACNDIVQFMRKKRKYKLSTSAGGQGQGEEEVENVDGAEVVPKGRGSQVQLTGKRLKSFLTSKKIVKSRKGTLYHNGYDTGVNYEDLVEDLSHNYTKTDTNLSKPQLARALLLLKKRVCLPCILKILKLSQSTEK